MTERGDLSLRSDDSFPAIQTDVDVGAGFGTGRVLFVVVRLPVVSVR